MDDTTPSGCAPARARPEGRRCVRGVYPRAPGCAQGVATKAGILGWVTAIAAAASTKTTKRTAMRGVLGNAGLGRKMLLYPHLRQHFVAYPGGVGDSVFAPRSGSLKRYLRRYNSNCTIRCRRTCNRTSEAAREGTSCLCKPPHRALRTSQRLAFSQAALSRRVEEAHRCNSRCNPTPFDTSRMPSCPLRNSFHSRHGPPMPAARRETGHPTHTG